MLVNALHFAAKKHALQKRGNEPYINHLIDVANLLQNHCWLEEGTLDTDNIMVAGILHDILEDTDTTRQELKERYGRCITDIVCECTDDKTLTPAQKKQAQLSKVASLSYEAILVKLADKYSNLRDFYKNPTNTNWSKEEILGYAVFCMTMVDDIKTATEGIETMPLIIKFDRLFTRLKINDMDTQKRDTILANYLQNIKDSD